MSRRRGSGESMELMYQFLNMVLPEDKNNMNNKRAIDRVKERLECRIGDELLLAILADLEEDQAKRSHIHSGAKYGSETNLLRVKKSQLENKYTEELTEINRKINEAMEKCPHPITNYYPDPSGNNDSSTLCLCCGKYL